MTISRKKFNRGNFKTVNLDRTNHPVSILLRSHKELAFKIDEIAKRIKMNKCTVRSIMRKLIKDKLVVHKAPYFAWK